MFHIVRIEQLAVRAEACNRDMYACAYSHTNKAHSLPPSVFGQEIYFIVNSLQPSKDLLEFRGLDPMRSTHTDSRGLRAKESSPSPKLLLRDAQSFAGRLSWGLIPECLPRRFYCWRRSNYLGLSGGEEVFFKMGDNLLAAPGAVPT